MKGIADTGFLVAFVNRNDKFHDWAISVAEQVTEPLLTCEAVLAETAFHLASCAIVFEMVRDGLVKVAFDFSQHMPQLELLAKRYADRQPDLADLCLIRMSELHPALPVMTVNRADFGVYRRNKREVIPLITPP
ncbi:MAG: PIN domain-containing protein [Alphaproteobacteria bacterium]|nr:PIN domain-containing protein [Alphaproteobacteria bacterium]